MNLRDLFSLKQISQSIVDVQAVILLFLLLTVTGKKKEKRKNGNSKLSHFLLWTLRLRQVIGYCFCVLRKVIFMCLYLY